MTSANCRNGEAAIIQPRADRRFSPRNTVADAEIHGLKDEVPSFQMLHFRSNKDRIFRILRLFFFLLIYSFKNVCILLPKRVPMPVP